VFVVLALFALVSAILAVNPLGSAMASSNNGGSGGAFSNTAGKTSSTSSNSHSSKGSAVILIPVNSGDPALDKQINKFYSCISKTHMDPPTKDQLDSCYFQNVGGQSSSSQTSDSDTQSQKLSKSKIDSSQPGMLVEVP
jgi:hypothetical protein